jgi:uncharacterized membrane protein YphA (DoxX/SURF4 family)
MHKYTYFMKQKTIIYWISTVLVLLAVGLGSFADLLKIDAIKQSTAHIGFPEYIIPFLGILKLLASITIVLPAAIRFREAAYAGMVFYFVGATYCHVAVGDGADKWGTTLVILIIILVSYFFRPNPDFEEVKS